MSFEVAMEETHETHHQDERDEVVLNSTRMGNEDMTEYLRWADDGGNNLD